MTEAKISPTVPGFTIEPSENTPKCPYNVPIVKSKALVELFKHQPLKPCKGSKSTDRNLKRTQNKTYDIDSFVKMNFSDANDNYFESIPLDPLFPEVNDSNIGHPGKGTHEQLIISTEATSSMFLLRPDTLPFPDLIKDMPAFYSFRPALQSNLHAAQLRPKQDVPSGKENKPANLFALQNVSNLASAVTMSVSISTNELSNMPMCMTPNWRTCSQRNTPGNKNSTTAGAITCKKRAVSTTNQENVTYSSNSTMKKATTDLPIQMPVFHWNRPSSVGSQLHFTSSDLPKASSFTGIPRNR